MKYPNGFYQMDSRIFERGLKPIAFTVYNYLVSCAGSQRSCFPSVRTIAGKCGCSESAARDAVKQLEALGLIRKEYSYRENRYGVRQQTSNTYSILPLPDYYENGQPRFAQAEELPL